MQGQLNSEQQARKKISTISIFCFQREAHEERKKELEKEKIELERELDEHKKKSMQARQTIFSYADAHKDIPQHVLDLLFEVLKKI